jgi:arsenate reductase
MKYYHNPRCSTSRNGLALLESKGITPEIVKYMDEALTPHDLERLLDKMDLDAINLIRKKEALWKAEFADKELLDDELVLLMIEYPQLMERPILETDQSAAIGRPIENLLDIL